jgi:hypothetical protein
MFAGGEPLNTSINLIIKKIFWSKNTKGSKQKSQKWETVYLKVIGISFNKLHNLETVNLKHCF